MYAMVIIFLDIDGVINPWKESKRDPSGRFGREALENLGHILDAIPEASIVISSTWRFHHTLSELKAFFGEAGIHPGRILDVTPDLGREGMSRYAFGKNEEIQAWLDQHPQVVKMVILDDVSTEQMEGLEEHFFQTEFEEGLTREQSLKIINYLNSDTSSKNTVVD